MTPPRKQPWGSWSCRCCHTLMSSMSSFCLAPAPGLMMEALGIKRVRVSGLPGWQGSSQSSGWILAVTLGSEHPSEGDGQSSCLHLQL